MAESALGGANRAFSMMIPLMMKKQQDEQDLMMKQQALDMKRDELRKEATEKGAELKRKTDETKTKYMMEIWKAQFDSGEKTGIQGTGADLKGMGVNVPSATIQPRPLANTGIDPMAEQSPSMTPRLEYLVAPKKDEKPITGMDQLIANLPGKTPEEKIALKQTLSEKTDTPSGLKKLIAERDALPEGDQARTLYDQAITKSISSKGMVVESDGKGGFTIRTNVDANAPGGMQKATVGKIEEKQIAANEGLSRISKIVKSFKPEFQEIPTKLGVAWSGLKSKMGANIPPEEKAKLEEFALFKQDALENINLYIKEITGAQMSEKEADRLRKAMPDPGDGIFGGDDPVSFKSKLVNQYKKLRMSAVRQGFYLKQGLGEDALKQLIKNDDVISLERMEKILDERGEKYEAEIKKQDPNISTADLFSQVKARLAKEFNVEF